MLITDLINKLEDHPDVDALCLYDHPVADMQRWKAALTAKASLGSELACFFVGTDDHRRIVLLFRPANNFHPVYQGEDMRLAEIGSVYDVSVLSSPQMVPIIEYAERISRSHNSCCAAS